MELSKILLIFSTVLCFVVKNTTYAVNRNLSGSEITGTVIDQSLNEPLPFVTVSVETEEGNIITGAITDEDGRFVISNQLGEGSYIVKIQFMGYETQTREVTIGNGQKIDLGVIAIKEDAEALEEVVVVGERSTIEQKIDRKVIHIGKDLTTAGATASEIMNNIPAVSVDPQTGNLSLRGNENVRVMVDGKLSNVPVNQLLQQIPSTSIKSIELITNPSAKYNPEGMSGIINIVLHKDANRGFNGSINIGLTQGENTRFNGSANANYRTGKVNFYGSYGANLGKWHNNGRLFRIPQNMEQFFDFTNDNRSQLYKLGMDFYLNDKNTLSFFTNQNIFDSKADGHTDIHYYDDPMLDFSQQIRSDDDNRSSQYNFNYKLDIDGEGHELELEADYNRFNSGNDFNFDFVGNTDLEGYEDTVDTRRNQFTANLDYANPLSETAKLELGLEARLFESDNDYSSSGLTYNPETETFEPTADRNFLYRMDIWSAYATYGQNTEKWSWQLGLRGETVDIAADLNDESVFTDDYIQLYPSGFLTWSPGEKGQYQLSFSQRVDRPNLNQVNPFREWSTPLVSGMGNPELVPQFTNSVEANYTRRLEKGSVTAGVFHRIIEDEINRLVTIDRAEPNRLILGWGNFDRTSAYGIEISANYRPTKWWNFNTGFELYSKTQRSLAESLLNPGGEVTEDDIVTEEVKVRNEPWTFRINNNFTATKKLTFSLFGMYRSRAKGVQFDAKSMYFVNTGARYRFNEGKGTVSLNFNDVFNTMRFAFDGTYPFAQRGAFYWESQTVYLGLNYNFGGNDFRAKGRRQRDNDMKQDEGGMF